MLECESHLTRDATNACECADISHEVVDVAGTLECHEPCDTNEERTSSSDVTCICVPLYEDVAGTCMLACTGDDIRD
jgi:hypothetical protein